MAKTFPIQAAKLVSPFNWGAAVETVPATAGGAIKGIGCLVKAAAGKLVAVTVDAAQTVANSEAVLAIVLGLPPNKTFPTVDTDVIYVHYIGVDDLFECNCVNLNGGSTDLLTTYALTQANLYTAVDTGNGNINFNANEDTWAVSGDTATNAKLQATILGPAQGAAVGDKSARVIVRFRTAGLASRA